MLRHLTSLATLLAAGGLAFAQSTVDQEVGDYQVAVAAAEQGQVDATEALKEKYSAALTRLKSNLDPAADTDAMLAIAAEIESLTSEEPVTAGTPNNKLLAARATYEKAQKKIQRQADAKIAAAADATIAKLRKLTGSLAEADDLDGALAAEQERRKLEADEMVLAAKERLAAAAAAPEAKPQQRTRGDLNEAIPRNGLFAYFPFDGRLDDSKGDTGLTMEGVKKFTNGLSGRALNLARPAEGARPTIGFPLPEGGRKDFSVSFCIKPDMPAHAADPIFTVGKEGDATPLWVNYRQSGGIAGDVGYNPPGDGWHNEHAKIQKPEPEWHHVVITVTKEEAQYYLDGQHLLTLNPRGQSIDFAGMHGYIGIHRYWSGSGADRELKRTGGPNMLLDELSVYTRVLSAAEARSLAKNYGLFDDGRSNSSPKFSRPRR